MSEWEQRFSSIRIRDLDSAVDHLRSRLGNVVLSPTSDQRVNMIMRSAALGGMSMHTVQYGVAASLQAERDDQLHISLPARGVVRVTAGRTITEITPHSGLIAAPGFEEHYALRFEKQADVRDIFLRLSPAVVQDVVGEAGVHFEPILDRSDAGVRSWLRIVGGLRQEIEAGTTVLANHLASVQYGQLLVSALLAAQPNSLIEREAPRVLSQRLRRAVQAMHDEPERAWRLSELAALAFCSPRSLQAEFQREFGHGPLTHLRRIRLDRVRGELRRAPLGSVTVGEVADAWGFTHLGRFAALYRATFGELPSETLRRG
jgi:AraC-like DNA-binding protein